MKKELIKIYELSSEYNVDSKRIINEAKNLNINVSSISSTLNLKDAEKVIQSIIEQSEKELIEKEIIKELKVLNTLDDLVIILNLINKKIYKHKTTPIELKFLTYHAFHSENRYKEITIPKKSGGYRTIYAPNKSLKNILKPLNILLQYIYKPNKSAHGFIQKRSVVTNAKNHINKNYVYNLDLDNFFTSIKQARVWKRLQLAPFDFNKKKIKIAELLSNLTCYQNKNGEKNFLPQGFPTSPVISNAICEKLDRRLRGVAKRFNVTYTRYADDITFSSNHNVYNENSDFLIEVERIILAEDFKINQKKTRLQKNGYRKEVTGLVVNTHLNVKKSYIKELRSAIYILEKYGFREANEIFIKKGYIKRKKKNYILKIISGKLEYLKMVKGEKDPVYCKLKERFNKCIKPKNLDNKKQNIQDIQHSPTKLVKILSTFSMNNNNLKYTTHHWDMDQFKQTFESYDQFIYHIEKEWNQISPNLLKLSSKLTGKISNFLFNKNLGKVIDNNKIRWGEYYLEFGWSSPELKEWWDKGNLPFDYVLDYKYMKEINNKTIATFEDVVEIFKNEIEVRSDQNQLEKIFIKEIKFLGPDYNVQYNDFSGIDFYTDVQWFKYGLHAIFNELKRKIYHPTIKIFYTKNIELSFLDISILQVGSICNKSVEDMLSEFKNGDFGTIYESFYSLCDWSIESKFLNGYFKIDYLKDGLNFPESRELNREVEGFTHILRFYL